MVEYYCVRRVNPYLGTIQVIDAGSVRAYSTTGKSWQARRVYDSERFWSEHDVAAIGMGEGDLSKQALFKAIKHRPPLPFPDGDRYELWLLHKSSRLPLALLKTCRWEHDIEPVTDPKWQPFSPSMQGFAMDVSGVHLPADGMRALERLAQLVNFAARPMPVAQWFERRADGGGIGRDGLRVGPELLGRQLPAEAFPELLVDEQWDSEAERGLVRAFHDWNAAQLLAHHGLARSTRARLEHAVSRHPDALLDTYPVLPEVLDPQALKVALVAARLIRSA